MPENNGKYIVAVDEGTTSTRACLYDVSARRFVLTRSSPIAQIYPEPSFVEENANEIYANTMSVLIEMLESGHRDHQSEGNGRSLGQEKRKAPL